MNSSTKQNPSSFSMPHIQLDHFKPLLLLNTYLSDTLNRLLGDKDQEGSLLNVLTSKQAERLTQKLQDDPQITRRQQILCKINDVAPESPVRLVKNISEYKTEGPKKGEYNFENGLFKRRKIEDKELNISETKSDVSTECDFSVAEPLSGGLNQARLFDFEVTPKKASGLKQNKKTFESLTV